MRAAGSRLFFFVHLICFPNVCTAMVSRRCVYNLHLVFVYTFVSLLFLIMTCTIARCSADQ